MNNVRYAAGRSVKSASNGGTSKWDEVRCHWRSSDGVNQLEDRARGSDPRLLQLFFSLLFTWFLWRKA